MLVTLKTRRTAVYLYTKKLERSHSVAKLDLEMSTPISIICAFMLYKFKLGTKAV